jgi:beta-N-acetylhexosaminidase
VSRRVSSQIARRRRLALLLAAALVALVVGIAIGAGAGDEDRATSGVGRDNTASGARQASERLTLRQQVGQLLISSFDGTRVPAYMRRRLRASETAGVILFGPNGTSRAGFRRLGRELQHAALGAAIVAVDQEGGEIRTLPFAGPAASQPLQGDAAAVERQARASGQALRAVGVNVSLGPVADVPAGPATALAGRAFAGNAYAVAAKVRAAVRGLRDGGVGAAAKHFPGLGGAGANTDDSAVSIDLRDGELERRDLPPFRAAIEADVPLVMLAHARYPATDPDHIASQSRPIVTGLLRDQLGFGGVIVTDSLEAQAVLAGGGVAAAAERSIAAGADVILMTGSGSWNEVFPRLLARARRDRRFRVRVRASAERVLALKRTLRLRMPR